jgi:hypothetical protein
MMASAVVTLSQSSRDQPNVVRLFLKFMAGPFAEQEHNRLPMWPHIFEAMCRAMSADIPLVDDVLKLLRIAAPYIISDAKDFPILLQRLSELTSSAVNFIFPSVSAAGALSLSGRRDLSMNTATCLLHVLLKTSIASDTVAGTLAFVSRIVEDPPYPPTWLFMSLSLYRAALCLIKVATPSLFAGEFAQSVWANFASVLSAIALAPPLQLETLPPHVAARVVPLCGDLREEACMWLQMAVESSPLLAARRFEVWATFVRPVLLLLKSPSASIRRFGSAAFRSIAFQKASMSCSFSDVYFATDVALDSILRTDRRAVDIGELRRWLSGLREEIAQAMQPFPVAEGLRMVEDLTSMLSILDRLRRIPDDASHEDDKVDAVLQLLERLNRSDRRGSYNRYVEVLSSVHAALANYEEAALSLLLIEFNNDSKNDEADQLWRMVQLLVQGGRWSAALRFLEKLRVLYESSFEFSRVANVLVA